MTDQMLSGREIERLVDSHTKDCKDCRAFASRLGFAWHDLSDAIHKATRARPTHLERCRRAIAEAKSRRGTRRADAYQHIRDHHDRKKD